MAASYTVVFAPEAAAEVTAIEAWWHKNRQVAPALFQQELKHALLNISAYPEIGVRAKMPADPRCAQSCFAGAVTSCSMTSTTMRWRFRSSACATANAGR